MGWGAPFAVDAARPCASLVRPAPLDASLDWKTADLNKLRVRELRKLVADAGLECNKCAEKTEFVHVLEQARGKTSL